MEEQKNENEPAEVPDEPRVIGNAVPQQAAAPAAMRPGRWHRFKRWYGSRKKISIPVTILALLFLLAVIPFTRYPAAGLVLKNDLTVKVTDSTAKTPVSGAAVSLGTISSITDGNGSATLPGVAVGRHSITVSKTHYQDTKVSLLVPIRQQQSVPEVAFIATGRQAKVTVKNLINQKSLSEVEIKAADSAAKTDKDGSATVVLPANATEAEAVLSLEGYNEAKVKIKASSSEIVQNDFQLTPAGKIYFLSKLSGRVDLVKTNLDGSERKTVLAGTGNEDDGDTVLLPSKDWRYLALKADRSGNGAAIYIINTTDDQMTVIDQALGEFSIIDWVGGRLVYVLSRADVSNWRSGQQVIKSYEASSGKLIPLNQTKGIGKNDADYAQESYGGFYFLMEGNLVFAKSWDFGPAVSAQNRNQASAGLYAIGTDGNNFRTVKTFAYKPDVYYSFSGYYPKPNQLNFRVDREEYFDDDENWEVNYTYFRFSDGRLAEDDSLGENFDRAYSRSKNYLRSPSGSQAFWAESRDGKYTLFLGDAEGANAKQIASLSDYQPYGWYGDDYLLISKKSSELYIIPVEGISKDAEATKITDYHKPDYDFYYGYGGI